MKGKTIFAILLVILTTVACQPEEVIPETIEKIVISSNGSVTQAPIFIAIEEGYFAEYGIEIEMVTGNRSSEAIAALLAGDIDVMSSTNSVAIINTITKEEGIKVVADRGYLAQDGCTYYGMMIGKEYYESGEITGPEDFSNIKLRTATSGVSAYLTKLYLEATDYTIEDVEIVQLPSGSTLEAFSNQSIGAAVLSDPFISTAINRDVAVLSMGIEDFIDDFQFSVLTFGKRLTVDNRDIGLRFMKGYLKGVEQYNEGKTERNLQIISEYSDTSIEDITTTCWLSIHEDGAITYDAFLDYQEWAVSVGDLELVISEELYWDSWFVEEAYSSIN